MTVAMMTVTMVSNMVTNFFADGVDYEVTTRGVNYGGNLWRQMYGDNYGASYVTFFVFARSAPLWQGSLGATLRHTSSHGRNGLPLTIWIQSILGSR